MMGEFMGIKGRLWLNGSWLPCSIATLFNCLIVGLTHDALQFNPQPFNNLAIQQLNHQAFFG
jgi:hypothetical protein